MKVIRLQLDFEFDFSLLALISPAKDYKIAWHLNKTLNLHLCRAKDLCLQFPKQGKIYISNFIFEKEYGSFRLLKNRALGFENISKPYLLPELKDYDYFIMVRDEAEIWNPGELSENIKRIPLVQFVKQVNPENLKSKENLIFS